MNIGFLILYNDGEGISVDHQRTPAAVMNHLGISDAHIESYGGEDIDFVTDWDSLIAKEGSHMVVRFSDKDIANPEPVQMVTKWHQPKAF